MFGIFHYGKEMFWGLLPVVVGTAILLGCLGVAISALSSTPQERAERVREAPVVEGNLDHLGTLQTVEPVQEVPGVNMGVVVVERVELNDTSHLKEIPFLVIPMQEIAVGTEVRGLIVKTSNNLSMHVMEPVEETAE